VTFAGDPAAGCATSGLCDYSGTETLAPGAENLGDLSLTTTERGSRRSTSVTLFLGPPGSPVHSSVQRTTSTAAGTETASCSDSAGSALSPGGSFFTLPVSGGRVTVGLIHTAAPVLGSRCAGPLGPDVASALPQRTVALRALERGATTIDLTGGGRFAAHGFSGTVTSTLVFRTGRPQHVRRSRSVPPRAGSVHITHFASLQYGVARLTGTAIATVRSAAAAAACGPFDACGLGGAITISPGPSVHGAAFLAAESSRVGARVLRAQLRGAGPAATFLQGAGSVNVHGSVRARLAQGSGSCTDSVALAQFTLRLTRSHSLRAGPRLPIRCAHAARGRISGRSRTSPARGCPRACSDDPPSPRSCTAMPSAMGPIE
jgi:hypothetical protein